MTLQKRLRTQGSELGRFWIFYDAHDRIRSCVFRDVYDYNNPENHCDISAHNGNDIGNGDGLHDTVHESAHDEARHIHCDNDSCGVLSYRCDYALCVSSFSSLM